MNAKQIQERIKNLEKMIRMETEENCRMMMDEVKAKALKDKNKLFGYEMEQLNSEFGEKMSQDEINKKLEKSRKNNEIKLEMQKFRNELLDRLKLEVETKIRSVVKDPIKYKDFLKSLILEGLVRLLETNVKIRATKNDLPLVKQVLEDVKKDYAEFMKINAEKEVEIQIGVFEKAFLHDEVIGGVIIYCNNNKIVFNNTIRARLDLSFNTSMPDIRRIMFTSLARK